LQDASGNTIIGEIPNPGCVGSGSPFAASIINARLWSAPAERSGDGALDSQ
jgi:hypothetical protein